MRSYSGVRRIIFAISAIVLASGSWTVEVQGQSAVEPVLQPAPRTINLTVEQRFIIKEIVLKDLNLPKVRSDAPETIGDRVPDNIELHAMPSELAQRVPQAKSHTFFVKDDAIVLVSPSDRTVCRCDQKLAN